MKHFRNENYKPENYRYIGKVNVSRKDAREIVTGKCTFLDDFTLPRMLIGRALRSPHAHARIVHIDVEKAKKVEGVAAVLTYKDVDQSWKMGWPPMKPILGQELMYVGDPVALIAAETREIADAAAELIEVEYEVLPSVLDGMEAVKDGAPQLYPDQFKNNIVTPGYPPFQKDGPFWHLVKGDVDKGFEECAYIAEDTVEVFKKNYVGEGDIYTWRDGRQWQAHSVTYVKAIEEAAEQFQWKDKWKGWGVPTWTSPDGKKVHGVGVGIIRSPLLRKADRKLPFAASPLRR